MYADRNYDKKMEREPEKMKVLKEQFPSFFAENPKPVIIHVNDAFMFKVMKSMHKSQIDPNISNMKEYLSPPQPEGVQLSYDIVGEDGRSRRYEYAIQPPQPVLGDLSGKKVEFAFNSGNTQTLQHNKFLNNPADLDLLYFLYFYCPEFTNGASPNKKENGKYSFYIEEKAQAKQASSIKSDAMLAQELSAFSGSDLARILTGLHLRVSNNSDTDFNTLFYYLKSADEDQKAVYNDLKTGLKKSVNKPSDLGESGLILAEEIQKWIDGEKIKIVNPEQVNDDFPKAGWYQKPVDGEGDPTVYNKTIFYKFVDGVSEQRIALEDHLSINTELLKKLRSRWK